MSQTHRDHVVRPRRRRRRQRRIRRRRRRRRHRCRRHIFLFPITVEGMYHCRIQAKFDIGNYPQDFV